MLRYTRGMISGQFKKKYFNIQSLPKMKREAMGVMSSITVELFQ